MKNISFIILFSIIIVSCSRTIKKGTDSDWIELNLKEKNCNISFPFNDYKIHNKEYFVENIGNVHSFEVDLNSQEKDDSNLAYKLTVYDYPEFNFYNSPETIDDFLNGTAENLLQALNASRIFEKKN